MNIYDKYRAALEFIQKFSDNDFFPCEGEEVNLNEELDNLNVGLYHQKIRDILKKQTTPVELGTHEGKKGALPPVWGEFPYEKGIPTGEYTDTVTQINPDGTYLVWNSQDAMTLAYDEEFSIYDNTGVRFLSAVLTSLQITSETN